MGSVSTPDTQNSSIRSKQQQQHSYQQQQSQQLLQSQHQLQVPDIFYTQGGTIEVMSRQNNNKKSFQEKPVEIKHLFLKPILNYNNKFRRLHICSSSSSNNIRHQHLKTAATATLSASNNSTLWWYRLYVVFSNWRSIFITSGR